MAKHSKLYNDSPTMKRGEDGSMGVSRPSEATADSIGTDSTQVPGTNQGAMPVEAHQAVQDMTERHSNEIADMHKRHAKEHDKLMERHGMKEKAAEKPAEGEAPKKKMDEDKGGEPKKVEKTSKEEE